MAGPLLTKFRRLADVLADIEADRSDQQPEEKRHTPAPAFELVCCQQAEQDDTEKRCEHCGQPLPEPLKAREKAFVLFGVLDQESGRTAKLAGHSKALQQSRNKHSDGRHNPNCAVGRYDSHQTGPNRHNDDRQQHCGSAPVAVGIGAEHDGAERTHQIRHAERAEGQKQRGCRIGCREKQLGNRDGKIAVGEDVIPLERVANRGGGKNFERTGSMRHRGRYGSC